MVKHNKTIATIYKPPDTPLTNFLPKFDYFLSNMSNTFLFGDFNVNIFDSQNNSVKQYIATVESNGFLLLNSNQHKMFTRQDRVHNSYSAIDHVITDDFPSHNFHFLTDSILNVDHKAIILRVFNQTQVSHKRMNKLLTFHNINHERIISTQALSEVDDSSFDALIDDFVCVLKSNTDVTNVREKFRKPFMSIDLLNLMKIRDNYRKLFKKYNTEEMRIRYHYYKRAVTTQLREAKKSFFTEKISENITDLRKTWKYLNNIIYNRDTLSNDSDDVSLITLNGKNLTNKHSITEAFNRHFVTVASNIKASLPTTNFDPMFHDFDISDAFIDTATSEDEILTIIDNMRRKSIPCFDTFNLNIYCRNHKIERVSKYKTLGLVLDDKLNFDDHVQGIYNKCLSMTFAIKRTIHSMNIQLAYQLYFAHIYSHLIFLNPLWSSYLPVEKNMLCKLNSQAKLIQLQYNNIYKFTIQQTVSAIDTR
ncbi:CLUMA_CG016606, isoform A [Clunio marinus]|uniref:CLUMA_CG016606, isoform A n=1 Tax=Clunio marinus TaxID=568069 RepID=A0A1J1ISG9_9DIPT|nr:CLUMA_CG016606, isoform A [Clunio marinus]